MSISKLFAFFVVVAFSALGCLNTIDDPDQDMSFDLEGQSGGNWLEFFEVDESLIHNDGYDYNDYTENTGSGDYPTPLFNSENIDYNYGEMLLDTDSEDE